MQAIHLIEQDAFNVVLGLQAVDPDGDQLTFLVDWGDGGQPAVSHLAAHQFPVDVLQPISPRNRHRSDAQARKADVTWCRRQEEGQSILLTSTVLMVTTNRSRDDPPYRYDWGERG